MKPFHFVLATLPLFLASCATETVQEKQARLCTDLITLNSTITALRKEVDDRATVDALKQAEERVRQAFKNVKTAAQGGQEAEIAELETAYEELDDAVEAIPDQSKLAQGIAIVAAKVADVETVLTQTQVGLRCPELGQ